MKKIMLALLLVVIFCSSAFAENPGVVMLSTKTCPACRQMMRVLAKIDDKYGSELDVGLIYLEDEPEIAEEFNVSYVPVLVFLDDKGDVFAQEVGYKSEKEVMKIFERAGVKF